ncbi:unnamed protein product [Rotaria sordida]|uniref:Uncharacterized protein n=1 Tax=Rotaria sordida TaxID=392033 RepID=A0A818QXS6_9BILA|nr:unnamed protein product [Rotaria sordida]
MTQYGQILRYSIVVLLSIIRSSHQTVYTCTASASCGCSTNSATVSRIVGGETASPATWSWTVSISIAGRSLCGGSILSSSWIITAAHCVNNRIPSQITIYAGSITRLSGTQIRSVSKIVVHSSYSSTTYVNDIALLKLASPLIMTDPYVSAICLPSVSQVTLSAGEWPLVGTNVIAVGWGRLRENGSSSSILQQVTVQTIDYQASTCTPTMVDWHVQFCAGVSGGGKDTCQGDSGGPLMMFSSNNQWVLVGVTSNGVGCAQAAYSETMSNSTASSTTSNINDSLTLRVVDAQTSTENGRKFTKYKVSVNYNGREWEIWRRYKEFNTLNEKLRRARSDLKLPGRRLMGDSFEPDFVLKRLRGLNEYVQRISQNVQLVNLPEFIEFFGLNVTSSSGSQILTAGASSSMNDNDDVATGNDNTEDQSTSSDVNRVNLGKTEKTSVKPDDFEFRTCIGKGSFGKVYLARHKSEDTIYAVKVVSKALIKRKREERHIMAERDVLVKNTRHPFLVSLQYSFQTPDKLYFVMDFVNGGELFYHLQQERAFPEQRAKFYAAEITSAIGYLHKLDIIYRDLKPENILLDREGHIRLTDFGLCKVMLSTEGREGRTATFCGTPEYLAPEVLRREPYTKAVDWWCLGSVIYEMLCARPPFYSRDVNEMYDNILNRSLRFIGNVSDRAKNIIEQLLRKSPNERLGSGPEDVAEIKRHPFFEQIDWEKLEARKIPPPWKPSVSGPTDLTQIPKEFIDAGVSPGVTDQYMGSVTNKGSSFPGFTYIHDTDLNS